MKLFSKLTAAVLAAAAIFSFASCSDDASSEEVKETGLYYDLGGDDVIVTNKGFYPVSVAPNSVPATIDGKSLAENEYIAFIMPGKGENPSKSMTYSYETVYVNPETHECKLESAAGYEAKTVLLSEEISVIDENNSMTMNYAIFTEGDKTYYVQVGANASGVSVKPAPCKVTVEKTNTVISMEVGPTPVTVTATKKAVVDNEEKTVIYLFKVTNIAG